MAVEEGNNKSQNTKFMAGGNYRRNRKSTDFDTLTLARELRSSVAKYVMNEKHVPKRWRYVDGKPAIDYARYIRDCISMGNDIRFDKNIQTEEKLMRRKAYQEKALSWCNVLQLQLMDICDDCEGATDENMSEITDKLSKLISYIVSWKNSDNDRVND